MKTTKTRKETNLKTIKKKGKIIKDQMKFFDLNASKPQLNLNNNSIFVDYANKEQYLTLDWLKDKKLVLDYGCGTGISLDCFFRNKSRKDYKVYGVDISGEAIRKIKVKYPEFRFFQIKKNKIPQIEKNSLGAAYMLHILHHTRGYNQIFKEIYSKLESGGKFVINDLTSNNIFNNVARSIFVCSPKFIKRRFSDDLVVEGYIPEKYKVNVDKVLNSLEKIGFDVIEVGYGHLFFFLFSWIDRFLPLSRFRFVRNLYHRLMRIEDVLLKYKFFQNQAELFFIKSIKKKN